MAPENASVFVAEDDPDWQEFISDDLEKGGHSLKRLAQTKEDALASITSFVQDGIQVAIVDGNLSGDDHSGTDGREIVEAIRSTNPDIKIIGLSTNTVGRADVSLSKLRYDTGDISKAVNEV